MTDMTEIAANMPSGMALVSLGAGVQSTALLLMACHGEINPRPTEAIFADTGWEPAEVYAHLDWLESVSSIPITRVRYHEQSIRERAIDNPAGVDMPLYVVGQRGNGILRRQCTSKYKIGPIRRRTREVMREHGVDHVLAMMGISLDEAVRMRDSDVRYITNVYPLVDRRLTRHDCVLWLERHGYPLPPKSACIGCPYHNRAMWRDMARRQPREFADAVAFDEAMRDARPGYQSYLHRDRIPLRLIDLSTPEDHGQLNLFDDECDGVCGV